MLTLLLALQGQHAPVKGMCCDVREEDSVREVVGWTEQNVGPIRYLVNCSGKSAGRGTRAPVWSPSERVLVSRRANQDIAANYSQNRKKSWVIRYKSSAAGDAIERVFKLGNVRYFTKEAIDNPRFLRKSRAILVPYTSRRPTVDKETLGTIAWATTKPLSLSICG